MAVAFQDKIISVTRATTAHASLYLHHSTTHHDVDPLLPVVMKDSPHPHSPFEFGLMNTNSDLQHKAPLLTNRRWKTRTFCTETRDHTSVDRQRSPSWCRLHASGPWGQSVLSHLSLQQAHQTCLFLLSKERFFFSMDSRKQTIENVEASSICIII